jgi:hypothetical protein
MNSLKIDSPETRDCVISCRVTEANKRYVEKLAKKYGSSEAYIVNQIIEQFRQVENDSNKAKPRRNS